MSKVIIMGMSFDEEEVPNFGSIRLRRSEYRNINEYILNSRDVSKLNSITNAEDGSTAFCIDTKRLYIYHMNEWVELYD